MDECANRTEENFREVRLEVREVRGEIRSTRAELQGDLRSGDSGLKDEISLLRSEMNQRFAKLEDKIDRRSDIALGVMATGFISLVVTHFIG
jgi:hypothetical protein